MKAFKVIVFGDVQGVGFCRAVQRQARRLGVAGSAKNRKDGTVEVLAQGEAGQLESFFESVRALEPPIVVETVEKREIPVSKARRIFEIIHGPMEEELDEGLGAGQAQLSLLRDEFTKFSSNTNTNFNTLATRYDKITETLARVVEESAQSRKDFREALDTLTTQTKEFKDALVGLTDLARGYLDERRKRQQ